MCLTAAQRSWLRDGVMESPFRTIGLGDEAYLNHQVSIEQGSPVPGLKGQSATQFLKNCGLSPPGVKMRNPALGLQGSF